MDPEQPQSADPPLPPAVPRTIELVQFNYIKGNYFRVIHANGVIGTASFDQSGVRMVVYTERMPIPLMQAFESDGVGGLGKQVTAAARPGVVREVEAEIVMDLETARNMARWLTDRADEADATKAKLQAKGASSEQPEGSGTPQS